MDCGSGVCDVALAHRANVTSRIVSVMDAHLANAPWRSSPAAGEIVLQEYEGDASDVSPVGSGDRVSEDAMEEAVPGIASAEKAARLAKACAGIALAQKAARLAKAPWRSLPSAGESVSQEYKDDVSDVSPVDAGDGVSDDAVEEAVPGIALAEMAVCPETQEVSDCCFGDAPAREVSKDPLSYVAPTSKPSAYSLSTAAPASAYWRTAGFARNGYAVAAAGGLTYEGTAGGPLSEPEVMRLLLVVL